MPAFDGGPHASAPLLPHPVVNNLVVNDPPAPEDLSQQVQKLRKTVQLQKERNALVKELYKLDLDFKSAISKTPPKTKTLKKSAGLGLFPVLERPAIKIEGENSDEERGDPPAREYKRLDFKTLKELKLAVSQFGPVAPFTLSILEALDDLWLTTNDWQHLARATLTGGDFVLWKSEFSEVCKDTARRNLEAGATVPSGPMKNLEGIDLMILMKLNLSILLVFSPRYIMQPLRLGKGSLKRGPQQHP